MSKPTLRVAFCMGGGVSLGSFSGGALGESVRLLRQHLDTKEFEKVEFDVFAGASAGALSLALMLKTLADPQTSAAPESVLATEWQAWVKRIDIEKLVPDPKMRHVASVLDRGAVEEIARDLIAWKAGTKVASDGFLADQVLFACTLSNLNGIPIDGRKTQQGLAFYDGLQTTLHRDARIFALDFKGTAKPADFPSCWTYRNDLDQPAAWLEIAATSIACGAFPLAFEPVVIRRPKEEYGKLWPWMTAAGGNAGKDSFPFTFADGGLFNNEPLREAMQLINHRDAHAQNIERLLIFIDPNFSGAPFSFALDYHRPIYVEPPDNSIPWFSSLIDGHDVRERPFSQRMLTMLGTLVTAITSQASFKDWIQADKINNQLAWREGALVILSKLIKNLESSSVSGLVADAESGLRSILKAKTSASANPASDLKLKPEKDRVAREDADLLKTVADPERQDLLILLIAILDQISGLRTKQQVQMLGIGPVTDDGKDRFELAGDFISSFGGFFEQGYRQYDYDVGVAMAGRALSAYRYKRGTTELPLLTSSAKIKKVPDPTEKVFGTDPTADSTVRSKRFFDRAAYVFGDILDGFLNLPFQLEKLIKPLIGTFSGVLTKSPANGGYRPALVRVAFKRSKPDERFFFVGQKEGSDLEASGNDTLAVAETIVFYWAGTGKPKGPSLKGPHVKVSGGRAVLELRRGKFFGSEKKNLALPGLETLETAADYGLAVFTIAIKWPAIPAADAWRAEERLVPLAAQMAR